MINAGAQTVYDRMKEIIAQRNARGVYTAMGYTSNLDLVLDFHMEELNALLEKYLPGGDLAKMRPAKLIRTTEELLETVVYYCRCGIGGEVDIEDPDLIRRSFPYENAMGGTAVQAALALERIGAGSIVHLTDDSEAVRVQLDSPHIRVPAADGTLKGTMEITGRHPQEVHVILQFRKGSVIRLGNQEAVVPVSNRLILTRNTVNVTLPLDETYLTWIETHARQVSSNVLSSFNCILDQAVLEERLDRVIAHVQTYRQNNPDGTVYFEDAHYHDPVIRRRCIERLYPHVDIMSMNEEELASTLEMFGRSADISDILSCVDGVQFLMDRFRIRRGVVVHTKDYAMYIGDRGGADIGTGLAAGCMLATAKAANGHYGTDADIRSVMELPLSETGLKNLEILKEKGLGESVLLVPTFYLDRPKYTIGLGDSFTGGMQLIF